MFDRRQRHYVVTLLAVSCFAGAAGLPEAARTQDAKAVRSLLTQKVDVNARSSDGSTALLWSAHWNEVETADLLLKAGADANAANDFGMTPLSRSVHPTGNELYGCCWKSGANPNTAIATGETPLMTCAKTGSVDAVRLLIEFRAKVDAREPAQNKRQSCGRCRTSRGRGGRTDRSACGSEAHQRRVHADSLLSAGWAIWKHQD
jgi:ankyrin repeat protein